MFKILLSGMMWIKYRIREKNLVKNKPGGKNGSGKKAWWEESLVCLEKMEKSLVFFLGLIHIKLYDEVKQIHFFSTI